MTKPVLAFSAILVMTFSTGLCRGEDSKTSAGKEILNKSYQVLAPTGDKKLGTYTLKAVEEKKSRTIRFSETLTMPHRGKNAGVESTVIFKDDPALTLKSGFLETKVDGKLCMRGSFTISSTLGRRMIEGECTGFLNKRKGYEEAFDPPKKAPRASRPLPKGLLVFPFILMVTGPRILPEEGELNNVVVVEFPDDIGFPELISFKEKGNHFRLERKNPNKKGEYDLNLYAPPRGVRRIQNGKTQDGEESPPHQLAMTLRFDKNDQCTSLIMVGRSGKPGPRFVEIKKTKK